MDRDSVVVGCKHCWAKNRVPRSRIGDRAVCGRCHRPLSLDGLFPEHPVSISDQTFSREVLNFPGPVVVFYWAPWCGHCQRMIPVFDQIASEYSGKLKFTKLVLDQNPVTGSQYGIQSVPTLLFFKGGKQVNRVVGALPKEEINRQLQTLL